MKYILIILLFLCLPKVAMFLLVGMILFVFLVLGVDFSRTMKYSNGWVWQDRKGTAVKEFKEEKDGCIYYTTVWNREGKSCGSYVIERY